MNVQFSVGIEFPRIQPSDARAAAIHGDASGDLCCGRHELPIESEGRTAREFVLVGDREFPRDHGRAAAREYGGAWGT